jgi:hypothetical protein
MTKGLLSVNLQAAMNHEYGQDRLVRGGTVAGRWEYRFDSSTNSGTTVADKAKMKDAVCSSC